MQIIPNKNALHAKKPEGLEVSYFLFPEYEVHLDTQAPNTSQLWHHHEKVEETVVIVDGELLVKWRENGQTNSEIVRAGDLIRSERTPHNFANVSDQIVKFIVIKQLLSGVDKSETLKNDKILD